MDKSIPTNPFFLSLFIPVNSFVQWGKQSITYTYVNNYYSVVHYYSLSSFILNPFVTAVHSAELTPLNGAPRSEVYTLHVGKLVFDVLL